MASLLCGGERCRTAQHASYGAGITRCLEPGLQQELEGRSRARFGHSAMARGGCCRQGHGYWSTEATHMCCVNSRTWPNHPQSEERKWQLFLERSTPFGCLWEQGCLGSIPSGLLTVHTAQGLRGVVLQLRSKEAKLLLGLPAELASSNWCWFYRHVERKS